MVYAAAPNFNVDGSHRPTPMPRDVRMLKRGDIRKPGEKVDPGALSLLPKDPVFAIDSAMAQHWWVKPFLRFTRAMPLDPTKPMATRTLINAVKSGEPLIIFPEGRLTVTGSLMKSMTAPG